MVISDELNGVVELNLLNSACAGNGLYMSLLNGFGTKTVPFMRLIMGPTVQLSNKSRNIS